ncbi:hypothetical protein [Kitasatospora sp. NPDC059673]|uniref:hypothetical protein n=1 Tax=Kitasatospora sp. NPDC059673 TaxID=3346901 RepID=UPI0036AD8EA6
MPALPEQDFEDRLCQVFHETGERFVPDIPLLAMGGAARGRRRRRRRLALGSAAAMLAVSGVTAAVLPNALRTDSVGPAAVAPAPSGDGVPDGARIPQEAHMVSAVAERLPKELRIVRSDGSAAGSAAIPTTQAWAELTLDDGHGQSLLAVRVNHGGQRSARPCPDEPAPDVKCQEETLEDGSMVAVTQFTSQGKGPYRYAGVEWTTPDGMRVTATSYNVGRKTGEWTRPEPLLSVAQLSALAIDPAWRTFEASVRQTLPGLPAADTPVQRPDLLPPGLKVVAGTAGPEQTATLVDGDRTVVLRFQEEQADTSARAWFADAPVLPDDTRIRSVEGRPVPNAQGSTETIVDLLRPDGRRIRVTAVNPAGAGHPDAGRPPLITLDRLTAIARCPGWTVPFPKD